MIKNILQKLITSNIKIDKKILGRWNIEACNIKTDRKIDLSNEDHCGSCNQYISSKIELIDKNFDKNDIKL